MPERPASWEAIGPVLGNTCPISKLPLTTTLAFALPSPRRFSRFEVVGRLQPTNGFLIEVSASRAVKAHI